MSAKGGQWVSAGELRVGDIVMLRNGRSTTITKITHNRRKIPVYNITVKDLHNSAVSRIGVLVHNKSAVAKGNPNGRLIYDKNAGTWTSPDGLIYGQGSAHGNRVKHVFDHLKPNPNKPLHTVFNCKKNELIGLIDEAWAFKGTGTPQANGNMVFDVPMGRIVGTNGETKIRIVTRGNTKEVITSFPVN